MRYKLFTQVALAVDVPTRGLRSGDVATIVEVHAVPGGESGYTLEVFDAVGETIAVVTLAESQIEPLRSGEVFAVRSLSAAAE